MASEWEDLAGMVDGENDLFTTSKDYFTGTITVWWGGLTHTFTEVPPNGIRLDPPPRVGDDLQARYRYRGPQMGKDIFANPTPTPDGAETTFFTPTSYVPGTVRQLLNGQVRPKASVTEVDGVTGEYTVTPAPRTIIGSAGHGVRYTDTSVGITVPVIPITVIPVPVIPITVIPLDPPVIPITVT